MNNLSLVNIFAETGRFFYNINYMLNSEHLSLVNKIGDKTEFTITRVHCTRKTRIGFSYIGPKLYNMIPKNINEAKTTDDFKTQLKEWIWKNIH